MTLLTTDSDISYNGLTGQDTFAYNFRVDNKTDMNVTLDGVAIAQGDFTMTGLGNASGGNVILNTPLVATTEVVLFRDVPETQEVDYQPFDAFPAETHEFALDKLTMLVQENGTAVLRSLRFPPGDDSNPVLPAAIARQNGFLAFDENGDIIISGGTTGGTSNSSVKVYSFLDGVDYIAGTDTALNLPIAPTLEDHIWVFFDGITQLHSQYTVSGTLVTFSETIPEGVSEIEVQAAVAVATGTPSDNSVGFQQLTTDVVESIRNKNYIINPTFLINQRAFAGGALADTEYGYDRWKAVGATDISLTGSVLTINSGQLAQVIEDFGYTGPVTVSWVGTSTVNGANTSPYTYTKITGDDTLTFEPGTLSEVKFEIGTVATPFEYPEISTELLRCQRYYQQMGGDAAFERFGVGFVLNSGAAFSMLNFVTDMRVPPTITSQGDIRLSVASGNVALTTLDFGQVSVRSALATSTATGLVTGQGCELIANNDLAARIFIDAEL